MQDVIEFFSGLFDTDRWPARWNCGYWSDFHGWLYIVSDLMIWLAYFLIPLIILNYFNTKKTLIRFRAVYILFAAFILLCGSTHFLDAVMFWTPAYRLSALVRFITGVVSLLTVYHLIRILPQMVQLRTGVELETEIARREQVEKNLAEANARLSAFASIASHDLQEPLRKISTFATLMQSQNEHTFDAATKVNSEKVIQAAKRMQKLVSDVLALSMISDEVKLEPVDPREAIAQALDNLELAITEKNAVISIGQLPMINGNLAYITQLFSNLLSNSIKFNDREPQIQITGKELKDKAVIEVSDNGIGFQSEQSERIFQAFQRLHSKNKYAGTGIGLAICKRIMEIHKGTITPNSTPGAGTVFILTFQLANLK